MKCVSQIISKACDAPLTCNSSGWEMEENEYFLGFKNRSFMEENQIKLLK